MATLNQNINQAISDFDSIKTAIQNKGVTVPSGTPTSQYASKISTIQTGVTPSGTIQITQNGTADVTNYASANVAVPQPSGTVNITQNGSNIDVSQYASANVTVPVGITPSGTIQLTQNGTADVTNYASANVAVPQPSGTVNITQNGSNIDVSQYASANVAVPVGITPSGTINISSNGVVNVANFEQAMVCVSVSGSSLSGIIDKSLESVSIPAAVETIGQYAFYNCSCLTMVIMSNNVATIEEYAFAGSQPGYGPSLEDGVYFSTCLEEIKSYAFKNSSLMSADLSDTSLITIGAHAFDHAGALSEIILPDTLEEIGAEAFKDSYLTDIYYTGTQADWGRITIGTNALPRDVTIHYNWSRNSE